MNESDVTCVPATPGVPVGWRAGTPTRDGPRTGAGSRGAAGGCAVVQPFSFDDGSESTGSKTEVVESEGDGGEPGDGTVTAGSRGSANDVPSAPWTVRDDVLDQRPDRQVLVVGDGVVGRTVTALLQRSGYEPVLAATLDHDPERALVHLDAAALEGLAHLDLAGPVRDRGTRVESVRVTRAGAESTGSGVTVETVESPGASSVVVEARALRRLLAAHHPLERAQTSRTVARVTERADGIDVEFGDGVEESFDAVVDTVGATPLEHGAGVAPSTHSYAQYVRRCEVDPEGERQVRDVWVPGALVQAIPGTGGAEGCLRVTTSRGDVTGLTECTRIDEAVGVAAGVVADVLRAGEPTRVEQVRSGAKALSPAAWGAGRIARCGEAAYPVAPATGRRVSLGVRDAVAFVSALARSDRSTTATIAAYATARERRFAALGRRSPVDAHDSHASTPGADGTLDTLDAFRTLALDGALDTTPDSL
ncbi:hypothetical protein [Halorubellus salinus]|uniref:hypothetical protein n=1 Tax=Halorubellus salinus TaxID=755309 RepID=UPI001D080EF1|nr:hypothetical protein [Halorubellus salinus]